MKKIWCLLLAAAMVTGAAQASHAVDFKAKGVWLASFQYGQNGNFTNGGHTGYDPSEDEFEARSRVRLVIDAVADENLSGQVYFEIGKSIWGKAEDPQSVFGNFSFYSYKKACGQKKTVRGSKNSRRLSNDTPAI